MAQHYDCDIRLDKSGRPDVDYYVKEAKRLRFLAFVELFHGLGEWLKTRLGKQYALPFRSSL